MSNYLFTMDEQERNPVIVRTLRSKNRNIEFSDDMHEFFERFPYAVDEDEDFTEEI